MCLCSNSARRLSTYRRCSYSCSPTCWDVSSRPSYPALALASTRATGFGISSTPALLVRLRACFYQWPRSDRTYITTDLKEHVAAQIMANTAATAAQACFVFASDDLFYNIHVNVRASYLQAA